MNIYLRVVGFIGAHTQAHPTRRVPNPSEHDAQLSVVEMKAVEILPQISSAF